MEDQRPKKQLTNEEIERLRKIIEDDERMKWLWSSARVWAGWIGGALAGYVLFKENIIKFFTGAH